MEQSRGTVVFLHYPNRYGLVKAGEDLCYFSCAGCIKPEFESLREGHEVTFLKIDTPRGSKAIKLQIVEESID